MTSQPTLSVVVCTYNGAEKLEFCLAALLRQQLNVDVLVIDDGSTDGTVAIAQRYEVDIIRHQINQGISVARNTGLRESSTSIVAFCDDDCTPPPDWTEKLLAAWIESPGASVIGGLVDVDHPITIAQRYLVFHNPLVPLEIELAHKPSVWYRVARHFHPPQLRGDHPIPVYSVVGANMSVNRDRALKVGGFNESLIFAEGEEVALCQILRARCGEDSVVVDPKVVLAHRFEPTVSGIWRRSYVYGQGAAERWTKQGGLPALPVVSPIAIAGCALVSPFSWPLGLAIGIAIVSAPWVDWLIQPGSKRDFVSLLFPLISIVDDLASILGFARGISKRSRRP